MNLRRWWKRVVPRITGVPIARKWTGAFGKKQQLQSWIRPRKGQSLPVGRVVPARGVAAVCKGYEKRKSWAWLNRMARLTCSAGPQKYWGFYLAAALPKSGSVKYSETALTQAKLLECETSLSISLSAQSALLKFCYFLLIFK